ncbi:hypothetical protein LCGC14_1908970 [marine sediment metagenome]|uniref:LTD domain-containing protein n=1 Tax=marine sediment metagenome TaxID=412755 RepID=A0A0F9I865_9ZZZZ
MIAGSIRADRRAPSLEPLEPRLLLSGDVVISEFMAVNDSTVVDVDSQYSDWIEIQNTGTSPVNLDGWYLTDNAGNLTKWQFPAETLLAGNYLLVFASSKNRAVAGQELHTNFKLSSGGEYLGLVRPDGVTVEYEYTPQYPRQVADISGGVITATETSVLVAAGDAGAVVVPADGLAGTDWTGDPANEPFDETGWTVGPSGFGYDSEVITIPGDTVVLVDSDAPAKAFIPLNDSLGTTWRGGNEPFDDSGWLAGTNAVGYDVGTGYDAWIGLDVEAAMKGVNKTAYIRYAFDITDPSEWVSLTLEMRYDDGFVAFINGQEVKRMRSPGTPTWDSGATSSTEAGATFFSYDISAHLGVLVAGTNVLALHGMNSTASNSDFLIQPRLSGQTGTSAYRYQDIIETDLAGGMEGVNPSAYVRVPFAVPEGKVFSTLTLRMKYDDGFVAYINGVKVAERNAPGSPAWNSAATAGHLDDDALVFETIDISGYLPQINLDDEATNILAIHGLNIAAGDSDFLVVPELAAVSILGDELRYFSVYNTGHCRC